MSTLREENKLLAIGERLRENPRTILLSIPVLGWGIFWFGLMGDRDALAGAFGHLGLTFRLYYKHHWQNKTFLKIAYWLLLQAARLGTGDGQPTVRMVMGTIAAELENQEQAQVDYEAGIQMAKKIKDEPQAAFIESHLGKLLLDKKRLDHTYKVLSQFAKGKTDMRPHVWLSNAEIGLSEWYLAAGDKKRARLWANKVAARADKHDLKTRRLDAQNLKKKISVAVILLLSFYPTQDLFLTSF